jgi:hypothetical protein
MGEVAAKGRIMKMSGEFLLALGRGTSEAKSFVISRVVDP